MSGSDNSQARIDHIINNMMWIAPVLWIIAGVVIIWALVETPSDAPVVAYLVWMLAIPLAIYFPFRSLSYK